MEKKAVHKKGKDIDQGGAFARNAENSESILELIFVYNAGSGLLKALTDYVYKEIKPKTYACNLCALTYGSVGMKREWRRFIHDLELPVEFLHRNEFLGRYHLDSFNFPAAFVKKGPDIILLISHTDINQCKSLEDLIELTRKKLREIKFD